MQSQKYQNTFYELLNEWILEKFLEKLKNKQDYESYKSFLKDGEKPNFAEKYEDDEVAYRIVNNIQNQIEQILHKNNDILSNLYYESFKLTLSEFSEYFYNLWNKYLERQRIDNEEWTSLMLDKLIKHIVNNSENLKQIYYKLMQENKEITNNISNKILHDEKYRLHIYNFLRIAYNNFFYRTIESDKIKLIGFNKSLDEDTPIQDVFCNIANDLEINKANNLHELSELLDNNVFNDKIIKETYNYTIQNELDKAEEKIISIVMSSKNDKKSSEAQKVGNLIKNYIRPILEYSKRNNLSLDKYTKLISELYINKAILELIVFKKLCDLDYTCAPKLIIYDYDKDTKKKIVYEADIIVLLNNKKEIAIIEITTRRDKDMENKIEKMKKAKDILENKLFFGKTKMLIIYDEETKEENDIHFVSFRELNEINKYLSNQNTMTIPFNQILTG